jgi:hypothetical protein
LGFGNGFGPLNSAFATVFTAALEKAGRRLHFRLTFVKIRADKKPVKWTGVEFVRQCGISKVAGITPTARHRRHCRR